MIGLKLKLLEIGTSVLWVLPMPLKTKTLWHIQLMRQSIAGAAPDTTAEAKRLRVLRCLDVCEKNAKLGNLRLVAQLLGELNERRNH